MLHLARSRQVVFSAAVVKAFHSKFSFSVLPEGERDKKGNVGSETKGIEQMRRGELRHTVW